MKHSAWLKLGVKRSLVSLVARYNSRKGVLGVEIRSTVGLGAKLEWCLEIMAYCNDHGLLPQFRFSYPDTEQPLDYFGSLFRIRDSQERQVRFVRISSIVELDLGKDYDQVLTIGLAHYLINKYLVVKEDVVSEVDAFCRRQFGEGRVVGVHYRGTDKVQESPLVAYESVRRNIAHYLELYPTTDRIFVATDDAHFLDHLQNASLGRTIVYRDDSFRSRDGRSIHESSFTDKYAINRDAIVNCLILSRCEALLKTASILSGWSKLFNPRLPVVMLNKPHDEHLWFPERVLVGENLFEPIK
jgi:Nodulation protein Z (NodZ)